MTYRCGNYDERQKSRRIEACRRPLEPLRFETLSSVSVSIFPFPSPQASYTMPTTGVVDAFKSLCPSSRTFSTTN